MKPKKRKCAHCGTIFRQKRNGQAYCNSNCRFFELNRKDRVMPAEVLFFIRGAIKNHLAWGGHWKGSTEQ